MLSERILIILPIQKVSIKMKLAANISLMFNDLPLKKRIKKAVELGFQGIEVQFPYEQPVNQWQQLLNEAQLPLVLINLPAGDFMQGGDGLACHPQRQAEFKQALEQSLPYIEQLQPSAINVLAGRQATGYSYQACFEQLAENLTLACQTLAKFPIKVTCEPINNLDQPNYLLPKVVNWQLLAEKIQQANFGLQLDFYHAAKMGESLPQLISEQAQAIVHVQFADYPGRSHPGTGQLNINQAFQQLKQQGYQGWLAAEFISHSSDNFSWIPHIHATT